MDLAEDEMRKNADGAHFFCNKLFNLFIFCSLFSRYIRKYIEIYLRWFHCKMSHDCIPIGIHLLFLEYGSFSDPSVWNLQPLLAMPFP